MAYIKKRLYLLLRKIEQYIKFDMVYLAKGSFWVNLNFILGSGSSFLLSIAFAHFISKETYGIYQYVLSSATILSAFSLTGINPAVTQSVARGFDASFKQSIPLQFRWSIFTIIGALGMSVYYFLNDHILLGLSFLVVALFLPITNTMNTYLSYLNGKRDFKKVFNFSTIFNITYLTAMFIAVILSTNPFYVVLVYFVANAIINTFLHFYVLKVLPPNNKKDPELVSYGKHLSIINVLNTIATRADSILVFHYLGAADLAIYTFAKIIPDKIAGLFKSITNIAFPKFSATDSSAIKKYLNRQLVQLLFLGLAASFIFIIIAPFLFHSFFPKYADSIHYSQIYSFSLIVLAGNLISIVLLSQKATKELYFLNIVNPLLQILILFVSVYNFGLWGIIIAKVVSQIISLTTSWSAVNAKLGKIPATHNLS